MWTVQQLVAFFAFTADDRLSALWWLIALRGLRRGEAAGLRWADVDLDARVIVIGQQRIAYGHTVAVGPPKTTSSRRVIALDRVTARLLRTHLRRQRAEHRAAGAGELAFQPCVQPAQAFPLFDALEEGPPSASAFLMGGSCIGRDRSRGIPGQAAVIRTPGGQFRLRRDLVTCGFSPAWCNSRGLM